MTIAERLGVSPLLLQYPVLQPCQFQGIFGGVASDTDIIRRRLRAGVIRSAGGIGNFGHVAATAIVSGLVAQAVA